MTEQTPATEAGRRHLTRWFTHDGQASHMATVEVLAIEAEARADALREAADAVRALPERLVLWNERDRHMTDSLSRTAVLAILDPQP